MSELTKRVAFAVALVLVAVACGDTPTGPGLHPPLAAQCELMVDECAPSGGSGPGAVELGFNPFTHILTGERLYDIEGRFTGLEMGSRRVRFSSPNGAFGSCEASAGRTGGSSYAAGCRVGGGLICGRSYTVDVQYSYIDEAGYARWRTVREYVRVC